MGGFFESSVGLSRLNQTAVLVFGFLEYVRTGLDYGFWPMLYKPHSSFFLKQIYTDLNKPYIGV